MRILPGSHRPIMQHWDAVLTDEHRKSLPRCHGMRAKPDPCHTKQVLGECYPEFYFGGSRESFGFNYTAPSRPLAHPFRYFSAEEVGGNPEGVQSAAIPSMNIYETAGFVAVVIPFFSDAWIEPQEGTASQVTDYRRHYVNTTNGRTARYWCVRTSTNGLHIKQLCDPGTKGHGKGALTGAVRRHVELFWNDLKRSHWIDSRSRLITINMQLKSNYVGVRYRITLMLEMTPLGAILPSYDVETRVLDTEMEELMGLYANIALGLVVFFCVLEWLIAALGSATDVNALAFPFFLFLFVWLVSMQ